VKAAEMTRIQTSGEARSSVGPSQSHTLLVRITHWVNTATFFALLISGVAILVAHPRLYWGETGAFGSHAWLELPLPLVLEHSGWGRSLHFLAAWIAVSNGLIYALSGIASGHFSRASTKYTVPQRWAYLAVVFVVFPLMIATGLAMSPAIASIVPALVGLFGGHQSSRTIHFLLTDFLVVFVLAHVIMISLSGFRSRVRGMIMGSMHGEERL
jgi:thiosulfate reductase cytochrome b subunit